MDERARLAIEAGIDGVFVQRFDAAFAQLAAETWIEQFLVDGLRVRSVVVARTSGSVRGTAAMRRHYVQRGTGTDSPPTSCRWCGRRVTQPRCLCVVSMVQRLC